MLGYKAVMRHSDPALARRSLAFLGLDGDDPQLLDVVTQLSPVKVAEAKGQCLLRDGQGRIGRVRIEIPPVPRIDRGIHTTPDRPEAVAVPGPAGSVSW